MAATPPPADSSSTDQAADGKSACPACGAEDVRLKNVEGMMICDKCASKKFSSKVRQSIQDAMEKQKELQKKEAYNRRLVITKQAYAALAQGKTNEAVGLYERYLSILNTRFKTSTENLHPHLFDAKTEQSELLLMTAVFWDLARTLDKMDGKDKLFKLYLKKYVEFSIGTRHMILSSETLRKYISSDKVKHKADFENAYNALKSKLPKCFIAGVIYGPESQEVAILQNYRDSVLVNSVIGKNFIRFYYKTSPTIAVQLAKKPYLQKIGAALLNKIALPLVKKKLI